MNLSTSNVWQAILSCFLFYDVSSAFVLVVLWGMNKMGYWGLELSKE